MALGGLSNASMLVADLQQAVTYALDALARQVGDTHGQAQVTEALGLVALERGDVAEASAVFGQSVHLCLEVGSLELLCDCVVGLAGVALANRETDRAAQLLGGPRGCANARVLASGP
jgi:hypothetical protein